MCASGGYQIDETSLYLSIPNQVGDTQGRFLGRCS
ncbi:hypothetical protein AZE42_01859 [Rhizopogon vesiculosus]|uniref:Uncharacterized protein n=1 Tax=Rhizopogon vesiculosus TaxID=180088 RepID=A0A1J8PIQ1_9AGAM|nr:hypothetical protein AZE42_01859 [Rhizopogon vesiculosus]